MPVHNRIAGLASQMTGWRRDLHAHPELAFGEHRTSDMVAGLLQEWGIEVTRGIAGTGLVGTLRAGDSRRSIGLRADMDALPMQEATGLPYQSGTPGRMHACGHDGHTAMLLGAAHYLAETRNFDGTVHFIFQPAEENGGGGGVMVAEGLFERFPCDMVFGAHNDPSMPLGAMMVLTGPVCANTDDFWVRIHGRGGHAAHPEATVDPVVIGAHIVLGLQSLVSRRTDPMEQAVLSICQFHAGSAYSGGAYVEGTVTATGVSGNLVEAIAPRGVAHAGGGGIGAAATFTLTRSLLRHNIASARGRSGWARGGGVFGMLVPKGPPGGPLRIVDTVVSDNRAIGRAPSGGGVYATSAFPLSLSRSVVRRNHPDDVVAAAP